MRRVTRALAPVGAVDARASWRMLTRCRPWALTNDATKGPVSRRVAARSRRRPGGGGDWDAVVTRDVVRVKGRGAVDPQSAVDPCGRPDHGHLGVAVAVPIHQVPDRRRGEVAEHARRARTPSPRRGSGPRGVGWRGRPHKRRDEGECRRPLSAAHRNLASLEAARCSSSTREDARWCCRRAATSTGSRTRCRLFHGCGGELDKRGVRRRAHAQGPAAAAPPLARFAEKGA